MASALTTRLTKRVFLKTLERLTGGYLEIVCPEATYSFGDADEPLHAMVVLHDESFFRRAVMGGDIGIGESYMDGDWLTPDLRAVVQIGIRNLDRLDAGSVIFGAFSRAADFASHRLKRNTEAGSKKNIAHHYDLGNDFYRLFLDPSLAYSCALFESDEDSLETAQRRKFEVICRKLQLGPHDHVLEIGTGWGGFAAYAASAFGCRITTTTISRRQYESAQELFSRPGPGGQRIDLLFEDYRNLKGQFDKIVSIEMFEAVGHEHYDEFFGTCDRLLKPNGSMLLQTITVQEAKFERYLKQSDWIKKYIFPGAELASVTEICRSLARSTRLQMFHLEDIGMHYALTLGEWRRRFMQNLSEVRRLGFDARFIRMWEYYLAYCEAGFLERYISDAQLVLAKLPNRSRIMNEPVAANVPERLIRAAEV